MSTQAKFYTFLALTFYMILSLNEADGQTDEFQQVIDKFLPFSETVILGNVKAITNKVQEGSNTNSTDGLIIQEYDIEVIENLISTEDNLPLNIKLVSYGGELVMTDINGNKVKEFHGIVGWSRIKSHGEHIIFIEHQRRGRNMYNHNDLYLAMSYKIINSNGKRFINIKSNKNSSIIQKDTSIDLQQATTLIIDSELLLNTHVYNTDNIRNGAYAID